MSNTFGTRLSQALNGRTQTWLSEQVGVTQTAVSYWASDKRQPELGMAAKIAEALNVEPGWLAFGSPAVKTTTCRICGVQVHWTPIYGWVHVGGSDKCETVATP